MNCRDKVTGKNYLLWLAAASLLLLFCLPAPGRAGDVKQGEKIAKTRKLGNCVACHYLPDVESPGDIGPNLVEAMAAYGPDDRREVTQWIVDPRKFNEHTIMPPFGANRILTDQQIDDVVSYLYTLNKKK
ncbi:MAG TPA: sulfur oxidation c-type cytochrome SoxX [Desulfobulbus sp.]|nr:sulfur oxidation c-type cytochrome SoxX [Desulfobulbus sp.]